MGPVSGRIGGHRECKVVGPGVARMTSRTPPVIHPRSRRQQQFAAAVAMAASALSCNSMFDVEPRPTPPLTPNCGETPSNNTTISAVSVLDHHGLPSALRSSIRGVMADDSHAYVVTATGLYSGRLDPRSPSVTDQKDMWPCHCYGGRPVGADYPPTCPDCTRRSYVAGAIPMEVGDGVYTVRCGLAHRDANTDVCKLVRYSENLGAGYRDYQIELEAPPPAALPSGVVVSSVTLGTWGALPCDRTCSINLCVTAGEGTSSHATRVYCTERRVIENPAGGDGLVGNDHVTSDVEVPLKDLRGDLLFARMRRGVLHVLTTEAYTQFRDGSSRREDFSVRDLTAWHEDDGVLYAASGPCIRRIDGTTRGVPKRDACDVRRDGRVVGIVGRGRQVYWVEENKRPDQVTVTELYTATLAEDGAPQSTCAHSLGTLPVGGSASHERTTESGSDIVSGEQPYLVALAHDGTRIVLASPAGVWFASLEGALAAPRRANPESPPAPKWGAVSFSALSSGAYYTCGIQAADGRLRCWGDPPAAAPGASFSTVAAGWEMACALRDGTRVPVCWGGAALDYPPPDVPLRALAVGPSHACGIQDDDRVVCWANAEWNSPPRDHDRTYREVAVGSDFTCAVGRDDGAIECWGLEAPSSTPGGYRSLTAGAYHACALRAEDQSAVCWGERSLGRAPPSLAGPYSAIVAGGAHNCAIRASDDSVECFGYNAYFQVSANVNVGPVRQVAPGYNHTCVLQRDSGQAVCWGGRPTGDEATPP